MCFDYGALCEAEAALISKYPDVNLLTLLPVLTGQKSRVLFAMSLQRFQPEIPFDEALRLVNFKTQTKVANAVYEAWTEANKVKFDKDSAAGPQ
jgi:hypothetical protein